MGKEMLKRSNEEELTYKILKCIINLLYLE